MGELNVLQVMCRDALDVLNTIPGEDFIVSAERAKDLRKLCFGVCATADLMGPVALVETMSASIKAACVLGRRDGKLAGMLQFQVAEES